jgi:hypothetical protein
MEYDLTSKNNWSLIIIDDPKFLTGESFFCLFQNLLKKIDFNYVIFDSIDGSGKYGLIESLKEKENTIIKMDEFLKIFLDIKQLDWGDFFLFKDYPKDWVNPKNAPYPYVIAQSNTTVRGVDNQYFYIYTPYQEIIDLIKNNYNTVETIKNDNLEYLEYPE